MGYLPEVTSMLDTLGQGLSMYDYEANRARTGHAQTLKNIAAMGLQRRKSLADSLAATGMIHSGVNFDQQAAIQTAADEQAAQANQALSDRLANIARNKIQSELGFNINSLLPR